MIRKQHLLLKSEIALKMRKLFSVRVNPFKKGSKMKMDEFLSVKVYLYNLTVQDSLLYMYTTGDR